MTLAPATRLGPYEIVAPLGAGGMGEVYRARDTRLGREVAIKVLPAEVAGDPERLRRFEQEARAASALSHPNILTLFDVGRHETTSYLVTELLEGDSLRARLAEGALPTRKAIEIGVEVARGLAAAHAKGIVHRDLKPENLFLTRDGGVKILDFGLAKLTLPESGGLAEATTVPGVTATGMVMGTAGYMAPEQVRGEPADARSDLFALGCVLYELVSGRRAFAGQSAPETLSAILRDDPPALAVAGSTGGVLEGIVRRCLEKRPDDRFQSARDLGFALEALLATGSATGGAPAASGERSARVSRGSAVVAAGAALALALGVGAGWLVARRATPPPKLPKFERLTFNRGNVLHARFAPDGESVVYSAAWEGRPAEIFTTRVGAKESRPLGVTGADLFAVSKQGELLVLRKTENLFSTFGHGTLARVSLSGGALRDLADAAAAGDWTADGQLVVRRRADPLYDVLELPLGTRRLDNVTTYPRVSHDGSRIAVIRGSDPKAEVVVLDASGRVESTTPFTSADLAWHPSGELWLSSLGGSFNGIYALRPGGTLRPVALGTGFTLHDIAADGRVLLEREIVRLGLRFRGAGDAEERDLAWLDGSFPRGLSRDGSRLLLSEEREAGGATGATYIRSTDGSAAVRIADGRALALSDDGDWALVRGGETPPRYWITPCGAGEPRELEVGSERILTALPLPGDGPSFLVAIGPDENQTRIEIVGPEGRKPVPLSPGFQAGGAALSPDGAEIAYRGKICVLASGDCRPLPGIDEKEVPVQWSEDGRFLFVRDWGALPLRVHRLDLRTGARQPWLAVGSPQTWGYTWIGRLLLSRDGRTYAVGGTDLRESSLFVGEGLE